MRGKSIDLIAAAAFVALMAVLPLVFASNYLIGVLTVSVIYGIGLAELRAGVDQLDEVDRIVDPLARVGGVARH